MICQYIVYLALLLFDNTMVLDMSGGANDRDHFTAKAGANGIMTVRAWCVSSEFATV